MVNKILIALALSLGILLVPRTVFASTYYVSTTGSDTNPGTQTSPWKTIQKAANSMPSGSTATVLAGNYLQEITVSGLNLTFVAQGAVVTKAWDISGNSNTINGFTITDSSSNWGIRTTGNNNLIEGNEIYHTMQDGIWFFGSYNIFRGNYIHDILDPSASDTHVDCFQTWSWDWDVTNVLFEKNVCINNRIGDGHNSLVQAGRDTTRLKPDGTTAAIGYITFRNNVLVVYAPIWSGVNFESNISNIAIENNTIVSMDATGNNNVVTYINSAQDSISIINNLLIGWGGTNTYQQYIWNDGGTNVSIHNNDIYNYNGIPPNGVVHPGDLWMVDPKIGNLPDSSGLNWNFHLQSNSPLIDAGYNLGSLITSDFDGITRPQGVGYDIGAYEYLSGGTPTPTPQPTASPTLTPTPTSKPGDANGDNLVNETDFTIWLSHFGQAISGITNADFNGDGRVDGIDYVIWLNNYGK